MTEKTMFEKPKPKIVRVELAFSDGNVQRLTGEDAEKWLEACNGQASFCFAHNVFFPEFKWEEDREIIP